jgi:eukaryotic-like serine/threonine-protein kinase
MNACPNGSVLLQFLDGDLKAEDDARILAHLEDCAHCQEHLERLTDGRLLPGDGPSIETVPIDTDSTVDLLPTDIVAREGAHGGDLRPTDLAGTWELRSDTGARARPASTADFSLTPAASDRLSTTDLDDVEASDIDDADRTATASGGDPKAAHHRRKPAPSGWPTVPGYDILKRLGEGGMGVVYKARHQGLKRLVALKMIRGGSQARADLLSRFRVEAEAVARLRHPNIIQIYDIGEAAGLPFVALELLDGGGLDDRLAGTPQPGNQAAELMVTLARAVHVAHEAGIVHRDLKPTNVLYTSDGVPKVTDFGLAKRIDSDDGQTETGQIMGSPSYMAPEQARGHSRYVGPSADVYALGAILYEMLTGRPPFKGETPMETVRQVLDDDPVTPSRLVPRVPRDLETVCLKCLHKDTAKRYASAQALADDLERHLRGEPILARRTGVVERAAKWTRRRPLAAASRTLAALLVVGAVLGVVAYQRSLLNRGQTILARVAHAYRLQQEAERARSDQELDDAQVHMSEFLPVLEPLYDDPRIKEVTALLVKRRDEVKARLDELRLERTKREGLQAERDRFQQFHDLRTKALVYDTQFAGLDLLSNLQETRRAAKAALYLYRAAGSAAAWSLGPLPASLSAPEQDEVTDGCYELLLVLADAESTPDEGLHRLDEAARMRPPTGAYRLRRAACLDKAGQSSAAEQERIAAARLNPSTAFDYFLIGQERYKRGDWRTAFRHLSTALQLRPDHFWTQGLWAVACLQLGHPSQAKSALSSCLQADAKFAWLYLLRGFASYQLAVRAGDLIEKLPLQADVLKAEAQFQLDAAAADYRKAGELLSEKPNDELRYALCVNRGLLGLERRDFQKAESDLQAAIGLNARRLEAYAALARVYQKQAKLDESIEQYSRAIALRPDSAALYRGRADVELARTGSKPAQRARALADLDQAIRLEKPDNPVLARDHTNRGRLLVLDHRDSEALVACDAALKVVRGYDDAHLLRIDILRNMKRHDEVIRSCDAVVASGKATPAIYEVRSLARAERKDFAGAIEDVTNAMALRPDRAALLSRRGWLYIVSDAPRLALHDFEAAIRLDRGRGDAYNGRGFARLRLGEHRDAVADADKALVLSEPTSQLFYNAARVYALAAVVVAAEVRKKGQDTVTLVARYQDRATELLREALKRMPEIERASFWRDVVPADPALRVLRRRVAGPDGSADVQKSSLAPAGSAYPRAG